MVKSVLVVLGAALLCLHPDLPAHAAGGPLDVTDNSFVSKNFPFETATGISSESAPPDSIPGCTDVKLFQVCESGSGQISVALCRQGVFGPGDIEATLTAQVAQAKASFKGFPASAMASS